MHTATRLSLGSAADAEKVAMRAERSVPAYAEFLRQKQWQPGGAFVTRPVVDKAGYLTTFPYEKLLGDDADQTFTIFKSSGSSGQSFYWPQLKQSSLSTCARVRAHLELTFAIQEKKTLAVVGLALGSWIGGEHFSWVLKSLALSTPYPFSVFSPGSNHDEIIEMCRRAEKYFDQILLVVCPSAIGHIQLRAEQSQRPLPLAKMKYLVLGEPFPESLRTSLQRRAGLSETANVIFSVYGSADTGSLGAESPASAALRKLLENNRPLAAQLGLPAGSAPHFFHCSAPDAYLERVDGELLITRWQGVPLVRYNLHDSALFFNWRELRAAVLAAPLANPDDAPLRKIIETAGAELPDLIAISGRADACLILCGTNVSESMLNAAVRAEPLAGKLTGLYKARIMHEHDRQFLELELELRTGVDLNCALEDEIYRELVQGLGREQPEFLDDWRNVYSRWDDDPLQRVLRLKCVPWPALSSRTEKEIKQRGTR